MRKQLGILLFFTFILLFNCKKKEKHIETSNNRITAIESNPNKQLIAFLKNPIDLQIFKKKKEKRVTTSVASGMNYYFHPKIIDSIFYVYYYPSEPIIPMKMNLVIVFKHGKNKHLYNDETETLIELKILYKDPDLEKANLIGLTKSKLESKFGSDFKIIENRMIYSNENNILILELDSSKVKSFTYTKLSTKNIDTNLISRIIKSL